jgi:hypothetical protein
MPNARLKEDQMTETTNVAVKQKTVSLSSTTAPAEQRSSSGDYQLYNDTASHVAVYRQEWDVPKSVFVLAPGATSDPYSGGHEIYIRFVESGASTPLTWDGWDSITVWYNTSGYPGHGGVNNVTDFH